jgi:hypothetical protein
MFAFRNLIYIDIFKFKSSLDARLKILPPPCQSTKHHQSILLQHNYQSNLDTFEKENKARLVVAWWEAHKPSPMAQAQKKENERNFQQKRGPKSSLDVA